MDTGGADILLDGTDAEKYELLAKMPAAQYDRLRDSFAEKMGIRVTTLDAEVAKFKRPNDQVKPLTLSDPQAWIEPVDASELLDAIKKQIRTYVVTHDANLTAIALWIVMTYVVQGLFILPLLLITSPQKRCGKSTLQILLNKLTRKPLLLSNASTAPMFRVMEKERPALLLDEVDRWLDHDDDKSLLGLINAGHTRDTAFVLRCDGVNFEPRLFDVFAPKAISGIDARSISDTMTDRSIVIELHRRAPNETVERLRQDRLNLDNLRSLARRWAEDHLEEVRDADPEVPEQLNDRAADNWRPLLAIADLADEEWSRDARTAARRLSALVEDDDGIRIQVLSDIREIFNEKALDSIFSADLVVYLAALEGRPWSEWGKQAKPISQVQLARLLAHFGITTRDVREGKVRKAYDRSVFEETFSRYLKNTIPSATPLQPGNLQHKDPISSATLPLTVADRSATPVDNCRGVAAVADQLPTVLRLKNDAFPEENSTCSGVADQNPKREGSEPVSPESSEAVEL